MKKSSSFIPWAICAALSVVSTSNLAAVRTAFNAQTYNSVVSVAADEVNTISAAGYDDSVGTRSTADVAATVTAVATDPEINQSSVSGNVLSCGKAIARLSRYGLNYDYGELSFLSQYNAIGASKYASAYGSSFPTQEIADFVASYKVDESNNVSISQIYAVTQDGTKYDVTADVASKGMMYFSTPDMTASNPTCHAYVDNPAVKIFAIDYYFSSTDHTQIVAMTIGPNPPSNPLSVISASNLDYRLRFTATDINPYASTYTYRTALQYNVPGYIYNTQYTIPTSSWGAISIAAPGIFAYAGSKHKILIL